MNRSALAHQLVHQPSHSGYSPDGNTAYESPPLNLIPIDMPEITYEGIQGSFDDPRFMPRDTESWNPDPSDVTRCIPLEVNENEGEKPMELDLPVDNSLTIQSTTLIVENCLSNQAENQQGLEEAFQNSSDKHSDKIEKETENNADHEIAKDSDENCDKANRKKDKASRNREKLKLQSSNKKQEKQFTKDKSAKPGVESKEKPVLEAMNKDYETLPKEKPEKESVDPTPSMTPSDSNVTKDPEETVQMTPELSIGKANLETLARLRYISSLSSEDLDKFAFEMNKQLDVTLMDITKRRLYYDPTETISPKMREKVNKCFTQ